MFCIQMNGFQFTHCSESHTILSGFRFSPAHCAPLKQKQNLRTLTTADFNKVRLEFVKCVYRRKCAKGQE